MWRDELEIWLIARDSGSLRELFHNMRFEAHPALWYLVNYALSRLTSDPFAMQVTSLLVGTGAAALILWRAPFGLPLRVLLCFGYLVAYEFTIISRSYGLELLLALGFCALWPQRRRRLPWLALSLFLLANTNLYGAILAAAFGLLLGIEVARPADGERWPVTGMTLACAALIAAGIIVGAGDVWLQQRRIGPSHAFVPRLADPAWYAESVGNVAVGYLPLPRLGDRHFWNGSALELVPRTVRPWVGAALGAALLGLSAACLVRRPRMLLAFSLAVAAMVCITLFFWRGQMRQHLQPLVAFLVCAWLLRSDAARGGGGAERRLSTPAGDRRWPASRRSPGAEPRDGSPSWDGVLLPGFLGALFAVQVVAWSHAFGMDYMRPFSNARAAASFLHAQDLDGVTFVGSIDYAVQAVAGYGIGPIYYPESDRFGTFVHWGAERLPLVEPKDVLAAAIRVLDERARPVVLITSYALFSHAEPAEFLAAPGVRVRPLGRFEGAIVPTEDFHLYHLDRVSRGSGR